MLLEKDSKDSNIADSFNNTLHTVNIVSFDYYKQIQRPNQLIKSDIILLSIGPRLAFVHI